MSAMAWALVSWSLALGGFVCLELCLHGIRELASATLRSIQSEQSINSPRPMRVDQPSSSFIALLSLHFLVLESPVASCSHSSLDTASVLGPSLVQLWFTFFTVIIFYIYKKEFPELSLVDLYLVDTLSAMCLGVWPGHSLPLLPTNERARLLWAKFHCLWCQTFLLLLLLCVRQQARQRVIASPACIHPMISLVLWY